MDAPDRSSRSPSPQPPLSSSSASPQKADSPIDSPLSSPAISRSPAKNLVKFQKVKLNDAPKQDFTGLNPARVKEVKDSISQKTLFNLYETWSTYQLVEKRLKELLSENKKDPEIPALKQKLESTSKELKALNMINDIESDLLFLDMSQFKVNSDNVADVEAFCKVIITRMKAEAAKDLIRCIFDKELASTIDHTTVNRNSSNMAQIFITTFQKGHLSKIVPLETKFSGKAEEAALKVVKRLLKAVKDSKDNDLIRFLYSDLHARVEAKFPGKGDELVLSLITLRFIGPSLLAPDKETGLIPEINIQISKIIQGLISKQPQRGGNISSDGMEEGHKLLKEAVSILISKP